MLRLVIFIVSLVCFASISCAGLMGDIYVSNAAGIGLMKSSSFLIAGLDDNGNSIIEGEAFANYDNEIDFNFLIGYNLFDSVSVEGAARLAHADFKTNIPKVDGLPGGLIESALQLLSVSAGINYEITTKGSVAPFIGIFVTSNQSKFFDAYSVTTGFGGKAGVNIILKESIHAFTVYEASSIKKPSFNSIAVSALSATDVDNSDTDSGSDSSSVTNGNKQCFFQDNFVRSVFTLGLKFIM
ncbi:hypothetical protein CAXC1_260014 [Candidatus Xenohaliotis californiensis]|uniref:Outer membrane protein beta-barrel domain-containing protein n=1 Tax=Candidatus Xenohaliotis californiensis TaxID=84677 RepID=A0ABP0EUZ5_9RICK|nr:hypothetical protein CAXC1_260014 [Candidatus Xenohaliotis californiensis]